MILAIVWAILYLVMGLGLAKTMYQAHPLEKREWVIAVIFWPAVLIIFAFALSTR